MASAAASLRALAAAASCAAFVQNAVVVKKRLMKIVATITVEMIPAMANQHADLPRFRALSMSSSFAALLDATEMR